MSWRRKDSQGLSNHDIDYVEEEYFRPRMSGLNWFIMHFIIKYDVQVTTLTLFTVIYEFLFRKSVPDYQICVIIEEFQTDILS